MSLFMVLVVSFLAILIVAMANHEFLRSLSILSRIGILMYLVGLAILTMSTAIPADMMLFDIAGLACLAITVIAVIIGINNWINCFEMGKIGSNFWKSLANMIILMLVKSAVISLSINTMVVFFVANVLVALSFICLLIMGMTLFCFSESFLEKVMFQMMNFNF